MLTLFLMRHAKSGWEDASLSDHQRPLTARGRRDAAAMGRLLAAEGPAPALLLCSTAERAQETAELLMSELAPLPHSRSYNELYSADVSTYLQLIGAIEEQSVSPVMIVGHNPTMEAALAAFTGQRQHFSTACVACIEFEDERWAQVAQEPRGRLVAFWRPKEIHAG